jgi:Flp pilus assembly pilin Flp
VSLTSQDHVRAAAHLNLARKPAMTLWTKTLAALPRDRSGRVTVEQGLIAALVGVMVVSIVTTLSGTLDVPAPESSAVVGQETP